MFKLNKRNSQHDITLTRHVFVKHGCPWRQQSQNMAKKYQVLHFDPRAHSPLGHVMSVKCEEPLDELTVQFWLLYDHPNFKYFTLFVSGTELLSDRWTNRRSDYKMPPTDLSGQGHKKSKVYFNYHELCFLPNNTQPWLRLVWPVYPKYDDTVAFSNTSTVLAFKTMWTGP